MALGEKLRESIQEFLAAGPIEIQESGGKITTRTPLSWEVRGESDKPLLHVWSENCNLTRRVLAIVDHSEDRLSLAVERFGRTKPERLEMVRAIRTRTIRQLSREEFCEQLRRILAQQFPDETLERLTIGADLEHSLSGMYARGVSRRGMASVAFLAVPEGESQDALTSCLTYALLWLNRARQTVRNGSIAKLRLLLPKGTSSLLTHRIAALDARLLLEIFEVDSQRERLEPVDPCTNGNVSTWLVPRRESQLRRLAILELKASENVDLPLRAADYWNRIRQHQAAGDLQRYGYFPGIFLQETPPLVYLISPALRFHPATDALLKYLSPDMEVVRIGLAETWRRGIRVMMRQ